jgi:hypothetical protein
MVPTQSKPKIRKPEAIAKPAPKTVLKPKAPTHKLDMKGVTPVKDNKANKGNGARPLSG